jgi:hypothetical protein
MGQPTRDEDIATLIAFAIHGRGVLSVEKTRSIIIETVERLEKAAVFVYQTRPRSTREGNY